MGSTSSKTVVNSLSEQVTNIASSVSQQCNNLVNQRQNFNMYVAGDLTGNTITVGQTTDVNFQCASSSNIQLDLQNKIIAAISATAQAQSIPVSLTSVVADAENNITTKIRNNLTLTNIQQSYNQIILNQRTNIVVAGNATGNTIDISQGSKVFAAATLDVLEKAGVFNDIKSTADSVAKSAQVTPVIGEIAYGMSNAFGDLFSSGSNLLTMLFYVVIMIVVVVVLGIGAYYLIPALIGAFDFGDDETAGSAAAPVIINMPANASPSAIPPASPSVEVNA